MNSNTVLQYALLILAVLAIGVVTGWATNRVDRHQAQPR